MKATREVEQEVVFLAWLVEVPWVAHRPLLVQPVVDRRCGARPRRHITQDPSIHQTPENETDSWNYTRRMEKKIIQKISTGFRMYNEN